MLALQRFSPVFLRTFVLKQFSSSTIAVQSINDKVAEKNGSGVGEQEATPVVKSASKVKSKFTNFIICYFLQFS